LTVCSTHNIVSFVAKRLVTKSGSHEDCPRFNAVYKLFEVDGKCLQFVSSVKCLVLSVEVYRA